MTRTLVFKLKENSYTIEFPTQGKFLDIESLKMRLSNGVYGELQSTRTADSELALDLIDAEAYLAILIGEPLYKDLKVKAFRDLDLMDAVEIRNSFVEQVLPFIKEYRKALQDLMNTKKEV